MGHGMGSIPISPDRVCGHGRGCHLVYHPSERPTREGHSPTVALPATELVHRAVTFGPVSRTGSWNQLVRTRELPLPPPKKTEIHLASVHSVRSATGRTQEVTESGQAGHRSEEHGGLGRSGRAPSIAPDLLS